jgi:plastocyanin
MRPMSRRPAWRLPAFGAALVLLLAGCAPGGGPAGGAGDHLSDGMPMGDDGMGGMHASGDRDAHDQRAPTPVDGAPAIEVSATEMAFSPAALSLEAGEPTNVTVANEGAVFHDLDVDVADVHLGVDPGEQATAAVTIDQSGVYEAICTVPGHAAAGMVLTIDVK